jgi:carboxylesterase type B
MEQLRRGNGEAQFACQELADEMHVAWVRFVATGDPGWPSWTGHNPYVFAADQTDTYEISRVLDAAL